MKKTNNSNISYPFPWANIRIVLVETSHPGNIGGVARAMKNMQLESLYLVTPERFPHRDALARASGANNVLDNAVICSDLCEALHDCRLVIATSARSRTIEWPQLGAPEAARELTAMAHSAPVALVFGRENGGLNNEELDACQKMVSLPVNADFSSLNLACAVQLMAYEIRLAVLAGESLYKSQAAIDACDLPASAQNLQRMFEHLEEALLQVDFMPSHRTQTLMRKLMRFFYRSQISEEEVRIFRGIFSELQRLDNKLIEQAEKNGKLQQVDE